MGKILIKYIVLVIPILLVIDVKTPLMGGAVNIGIKEILFLVLGVLLIRTKNLYLFFTNRIILLFFLFVFFSIATNYLISNINPLVWIEILRLLEGGILIIGVYNYLKVYPVYTLYKSLIISGIILSLQIFGEAYFQTGMTRTMGGIAGVWLSIGALALYFNFKEINWSRNIKILCFCCLVAGNFLSERRTWVFITLALILISFFKNIKVWKVVLLSVASLVIVLFSEIFVSKIYNNERILELILAFNELDISRVSSFSTRLVRWGNVWETIQNNWFFGVGYGNIDLGLAKWIETDNPDNQYLELWLQNGFLALLSFIFLLFKGIKLSMGTSVKDFLFIKNTFFLLLLGGIFWSYITGFGILAFAVFLGIAASFKLEQFHTFQVIRDND